MEPIKGVKLTDCQQKIDFIKESIMGKTITGYFEGEYEDGQTSINLHFGDVALGINISLEDGYVIRAIDSLEITQSTPTATKHNEL